MNDSVWDTYLVRRDIRGRTKREAAINREQRYIINRLPDNPSYQHVIIDSVERDVAIINSDNLNEKTIISLPGEDIRHGGTVFWMNNYWLVVERDANTTMYTKGKLLQCNHLLKWIDADGVIREQWCFVEDGTKLTSSFRVVKAA